MDGEPGHQGEASSFDPWLVALGPLSRLRPRELRPVEETRRRLVADIPRIEVVRPRLELLLGDRTRVVHETREQPRLVLARRPQGARKLVVPAESLRDIAKLGDRDAKRVLDVDSVPSHSGSVAFAAQGAKASDHGLRLRATRPLATHHSVEMSITNL